MAKLTSQPDTLCFSSMLGDIVFQSSATSGLLTLVLLCADAEYTLIEETYWPDSNGMVSVGDLPSLVEPYVRRHGTSTLKCTFDDGTSTAIDSVTVLYGAVDVGTTTEEFISGHFLTLMDGAKLTAMGHEERLYAFGSGGTKADVSAEVRQPSGVYTTLTATLAPTSVAGGISEFDASPATVARIVGLVGGRLLSYTISVGSRSQDFRTIVELTPPEPSIAFVNSFGCMEFIHCYGTQKTSSKYTRSSVRIGRRLRTYRVVEERQHEANTGWLNDAMAAWADELLRSDEAYLWTDGQMGREIVVSDSKGEVSNDDDSMTSFEFTYTYAQRTQNVMHRRSTARLFTSVFDSLFN